MGSDRAPASEPLDLALVIPAYNEQNRLPRTLDRLAGMSRDSGLCIHVLVVDDGSEDGTAACVRARQHHFSSTPLSLALTHIRHRGKGAAVRAGMQKVSAPVIGYCDADLSAGPDAILQVYDRVRQGSDMAMGSRGLPDSVLEIRQPFYRERAGKLFNLMLRKLAGIPHRDTQCGLKLFREEVAAEIFRRQRIDGFAFDVEVVALALALGFQVEEVPIHWAHAESSRVSMVRDPMKMLGDVFRVVRPLRRLSPRTERLGIPSEPALEQMIRSEEHHWWHMAKRELIGETIVHHSQAPCLDIGCGGGRMVALASEVMPSFGVELSERALRAAKGRGVKGLARAEAGRLPFRSSSFGTILALDVIEHHPQPEALLAEVIRVLKDDGILIVTVPAYQWMWSHTDHALGHYRRYTRASLRGDFEAAGLPVERVTYFHSWLLIVAWSFRKLRGLFGGGGGADDFLPPAPLNRFFLKLARLERRLLTRMDLPFGLSVLAIARRPPVDRSTP